MVFIREIRQDNVNQADHMYCFYQPSPTDSPFVERYFYSSHDELDAPASEELIFPDGTSGLMFVEKGAIRRTMVGAQSGLTIDQSYLFGQKTRAVRYAFPTTQLAVFGAKFKPGALHHLFGLSSDQLTDSYVQFSHIVGEQLTELEKSLWARKVFSQRIKILEHFLFDRQTKLGIAQDPTVMPEIIAHIHGHGGDVAIRTISEQFGLNYKRLQRMFKLYVGMTPKMYCRIVRFNQSFKAFENLQEKKLTSVAYDCGYFDQMHFIRDVKYFTGAAPQKVFRKKNNPMEKMQLQYLCGRS